MNNIFRFGAVEQKHVDEYELVSLSDQPEHLVEDFMVSLFPAVLIVTGDVCQQDGFLQWHRGSQMADAWRQWLLSVVKAEAGQGEQQQENQ
jgi:hypothetical protein